MAMIGSRLGTVRARAAPIAPMKPTSSARVNKAYASARACLRLSRSSKASIAAHPTMSSQPRARTKPPRRAGSGKSHIPIVSGAIARGTRRMASFGRDTTPRRRRGGSNPVISTTVPRTGPSSVQKRTLLPGKYSGNTPPRKSARNSRFPVISWATKAGMVHVRREDQRRTLRRAMTITREQIAVPIRTARHAAELAARLLDVGADRVFAKGGGRQREQIAEHMGQALDRHMRLPS